MISAVVSARLAGLDRIKSGFTSRFANRLPIFGASRLPRLANGRSLSRNAVSSQLDFAWRMRNSVFMPRSIPICAVRPVTTGWKRRTMRQKLQSAVLVWAQPAAARGPDPDYGDFELSLSPTFAGRDLTWCRLKSHMAEKLLI